MGKYQGKFRFLVERLEFLGSVYDGGNGKSGKKIPLVENF